MTGRDERGPEPTATRNSGGFGEFGDLRAGTLRGVPFVIARVILIALCRVVLGMRIEGAHNVPLRGGVLVLGNHLHNADPVLICIAMPRPIHFMAKKELMLVPVVSWFARLSGAFPVDRGRADRTAIRRSFATLEQGIALGMFPEGTRSSSRHIEKVLPGAGLIALRGGAPVVPMAITGSEHMPFNGAKSAARSTGRRRRGIRIRFGEPFLVPPTVDGKRTTSEMAIDLIMREVAAMLPESYRGVYSSADKSSTSTLGSSSSSSSSSSSPSSIDSDSATTNAPSSS